MQPKGTMDIVAIVQRSLEESAASGKRASLHPKRLPGPRGRSSCHALKSGKQFKANYRFGLVRDDDGTERHAGEQDPSRKRKEQSSLGHEPYR